jgi:uncharacterized protein
VAELGELGQLEQLAQLEQLGQRVDELGQRVALDAAAMRRPAPATGMPPRQRSLPPVGGLGLLILQPSPFCNIDCDYCYLPHRMDKKRLPIELVRTAVEKVFSWGLVQDRLSIVWHAGEPLAVPISYYAEAFAAIRSLPVAVDRIRHSIQTNGMLIDDAWCELIRKHQVNVGVSLDGPAFIHDAHRKDRRGGGTHARAMKGVKLLQGHDIPFHVIAVVSAQSLAHPDEIFEFFVANGICSVGFNIEELEGVNTSSTLSAAGTEPSAVAPFFQRLYELQRETNGAVKIREFDRAYQAIAREPGEATTDFNDQVRPFGILSIDADGNVSTFSPELLGARSPCHGDFHFGSIATCELDDLVENPAFLRVAEEIQSGVSLCAQTCEYFAYCGGGAPSNKFFELGTFAATETMYCRHVVKTPLDIVLAGLEESLDLGAGCAGLQCNGRA